LFLYKFIWHTNVEIAQILQYQGWKFNVISTTETITKDHFKKYNVVAIHGHTCGQD
jgi:hypothetical protein